MSIDFYVAVDHWPTQVQMSECMTDRGYPISFKRFPAPDYKVIVHDGILAVVKTGDAYLEGEVFPKAGQLNKADAKVRSELADLIGATPQQYMLTIRIGSRPSEFVATAYVVSGLVNCFGGVIYDPQSSTRGTTEFAKGLLAQVPAFEAQAR